MKNIFLVILFILFTCKGGASEEVSGQVYLDTNKDGFYNSGETMLEGILVSNGIDIVSTDKKGQFNLVRVGHLPVFIIKPTGYQVSTNQDGQPVFYEQNTNKKLQFGLYKQEEGDSSKIVLLGDTQPHNLDEVYYILRGSTDELKTRVYDFSLSLGDVVSDNPVILPLVKEVIGASGSTSYFTFGNHDLNWKSLYEKGLENWDMDWINAVGPTYYAMSWGNTNIISMNNINIKWNNQKGKYDFDYFMKKDQMTFINNYLSYLNKSDLLIITSHARPDDIVNKQDFYNLFKGFSKVLFVFGHHHQTENYIITKKEGWPNELPAHCIDVGAVCGGHWRGEEDAFWIPSATMIDGTPKGYTLLDIINGDYQLKYKPSRMSEEKQMHIYTPDYLTYDANFSDLDSLADSSFYVNIYLGSEQTKVEFRVDGGDWLSMKKVNEPDPYLKRHMMRQKLGIYPTEGARKLKRDYEDIANCSHLWKASYPENLTYGVHELEVRFMDTNIKNSIEKHSFMSLSPEMKKANQKLIEDYRKSVGRQ